MNTKLLAVVAVMATFAAAPLVNNAAQAFPFGGFGFHHFGFGFHHAFFHRPFFGGFNPWWNNVGWGGGWGNGCGCNW